ncbi:phosphoethanolamine--lipid A transferase [Aquincola sp. S2]|uniref:Phosphoethanolamine--lipid A transferase n=1 Tax=Pseudaquabacterium terrae TaxID=2732868 RepID=A0ABX2ETU4_9BURK|nr:phosphoethanolamine--lipid A transferase [Aquabacterium terrae]NRF71891.1 phosphoethanolamine--lipid A transferase [Aquabacterium terrae]
MLSDRARSPGRHGWSPITLALLGCLWMASAGNLALWRALHRLGALDGWRGAALAAGVALAIGAALALVLAPFAWRRSLKPALALLLLAAAAGSHFMWAYGIVIDSTMLANVLQTDLHEARDLLSGRLLLTLTLLGIVPAWWIVRAPVDWGRWPGRLRANLLLFAGALAVLVGTVLAAYQPLAALSRGHRELRHLVNPLNSLQALAKLGVGRPAQATTRQPLGTDARIAALAGRTDRAPLLVLVLGETARADHFALNGYARPTTPALAALDVTSQRNAWSCGTSTAASVPCMFSHLAREEFDSRDADHDTLVDVLQHAGLAVLWLDNQAGCKGVCDRVPNVNTSALRHPTLCPDGECLDEILLDGLDKRLAALPVERRARGTVLVLHQMGSHGPAYHRRSPPDAKHFQPECRSVALQDCEHPALVNAYDNSIAYTDRFLAATIRWLQARGEAADSALLYVADHGESLGEHNLYLHGLPYAVAPDVQKHVAWISWFSPAFARRSGVAAGCLQQRRDERLGHEHYFHSVLGLLDVQTSAYRPERDFYRACRQP